MPRLTSDALQRGDPRVLGWLREWVQEGDYINRQDPSYDLIGKAQDYITGNQLSADQCRLKYLPQVTINEVRKAMQAHVSAITDLKPIAGWRANPEYAVQANLLNQILYAEWITTMMDLDLGDCVKYSLAGGTGDLVIDWDPHAPLGGAHQLTARDPRDTLPLRPSFGRSAQLWEGVCFREEHTVNVLKGMYPQQATLFKSSSDTLLGQVMGRFKTGVSRLISPADPLDSIAYPGTAATTKKARSGALVLYRAYFRDRTRNMTTQPIPMGSPGTNWAYLVAPGDPLYPRGRLVVATDDVLIYDGPNTYWHGMFPFCRLKLWSVPWQFLGIPLFNDLLPLQDAINDTVHDVRLAMRQWTNPDITYNRTAVSEATMKLMDPRRPGKRVKVQPGFGDPWKKEEGPNPSVIQMGLELWQQLTQKFADLAGTANLSALLQLRQLPSADTIQKYYEALTPEIRTEARQVELFLRDFSQMVKVNYFQFMSQAKRVQLLGTGGQMLDSFDFDPDSFVPALMPGDPGYTPELDARTTSRDQRAQWFHNQFLFVVAPNSVLAMDAQERKMMRFQLARMGYYDFWSLHETLETPNVGAPPAIPLAPLEPPPPDALPNMLQQAMSMAGQMAGQMVAQGPEAIQAGMGMLMNGQMGIPQYTDPASGRTFVLTPGSSQIMELRVPVTVTERLQAQQMLGIGQTVNPAGRKASGQETPQQEEKPDGAGGTRTTITESKK